MVELAIIAGLNIAAWKVCTSVLRETGAKIAMVFTVVTLAIVLYELIHEERVSRRRRRERAMSTR